MGAAYTHGDPIIFLNDDTEPQAGWLGMLDAFDNPEVGIVGCRLVYADGLIQHAGVYLACEGGTLTAYNVHDDLPSREVEAVTGACLAIRRDLFDELDGFDEGYRNGYEDVDLCLRARAAGWKVWYVAEATVVHHESQSGPRRWESVRENVERLQVKHGDHQRV